MKWLLVQFLRLAMNFAIFNLVMDAQILFISAVMKMLVVKES